MGCENNWGMQSQVVFKFVREFNLQSFFLLYQQYSTSDSTIMTNRVQHQLD